MSTWPDPTDLIPTTNMDDGTDLLEDAMLNIKSLTEKVNIILDTMDEFATPWTDANDDDLMIAIGAGADDALVIYDANGHAIDSNTTISTDNTLGGASASNLKVPTQKAIKEYTDSINPSDWSLKSSLTFDLTTEYFLNIPAGITAFRLMFMGVGADTTGDLYLELGHSGGYPTTGCDTTGLEMISSVAPVRRSFTDGKFPYCTDASANSIAYGVVEFFKENTTEHIWYGTGMLCNTNIINRIYSTAGRISIGGELDRIRFTTEAGVHDTGYCYLWIRD